MTRKGETAKDRASLFFPFVYFVYFVVLPRVTTKDSKYSKRGKRQRQGFLVLPFRLLLVFRCCSFGNHDRLYIKEGGQVDKERGSFMIPFFYLWFSSR